MISLVLRLIMLVSSDPQNAKRFHPIRISGDFSIPQIVSDKISMALFIGWTCRAVHSR